MRTRIIIHWITVHVVKWSRGIIIISKQEVPFLVVHMHHVVRHTGDWMRLRCRGGNWKSLIVATPRIGPSLQLRVASHQFAVPTHYSPLCHSPAPTPMSTIFMEHAGLSLPWRRRVLSWPCCRLYSSSIIACGEYLGGHTGSGHHV